MATTYTTISYLYVLCDPSTHEIRYVGITTKSPTSRLKSHLRKANTSKLYVSNWIRTLLNEGSAPIIRVVDSYNSWEKACEAERDTIYLYRQLGARLCNLTDGGDGVTGMQMSRESRDKIRAAALIRLSRPGELARLSKLNVGRYPSAETRQKLSNARTGPRHYAWGKHKSQETKEKISLSRGTPVVGTCIKTGQKLIYCSAGRAATDGFSVTAIGRCCRGRRNTHSGFRWEYII